VRLVFGNTDAASVRGGSMYYGYSIGGIILLVVLILLLTGRL
jgi:hypothetical protein